MSINGQSVSQIKALATAPTTTEANFRTGLDHVIDQVSATESLPPPVTAPWVTIYSSTTTFLAMNITLYQNSSGLNFTPHIKVNGNGWSNPERQHLEAIVGSNSGKSVASYPGTSYQAGWRVERDGSSVKSNFYGRFAYKYMTVS